MIMESHAARININIFFVKQERGSERERERARQQTKQNKTT